MSDNKNSNAQNSAKTDAPKTDAPKTDPVKIDAPSPGAELAKPPISPDLAMAASIKGANTEQPAKTVEKRVYPARAYVRSVVGDMLHLHTNEAITDKEVKIDVDPFAIAQIEAGKWEIVEAN